MNAVTDMLGCRHPIIIGAMGVICNPELVAAVSEAGGYGQKLVEKLVGRSCRKCFTNQIICET